MEGGREGEREGGREGGSEGRREGGREEGREGAREGGRTTTRIEGIHKQNSAFDNTTSQNMAGYNENNRRREKFLVAYVVGLNKYVHYNCVYHDHYFH